MTGRLIGVHLGYGKANLTFTFTDEEQCRKIADDFYGKDIELDIDIKKHREKRSLNANAYCWKLCTEIAACVRSSKEEVYRRAIREINQTDIKFYKDIELKEDAAKTMEFIWSEHGVGWITEKLDEGEKDGYVLVRFYYGSSCYNTKQMTVLIDWLVEEAKIQGIEVLSEQELSLLKDGWKDEISK